ncbi:MAG: penicillin-binding protein activator [Deltaproteobacteria bacterium]|nr:penicillin-binding protein activator [Deltaproteobacteria bacterium]
MASGKPLRGTWYPLVTLSGCLLSCAAPPVRSLPMDLHVHAHVRAEGRVDESAVPEGNIGRIVAVQRARTVDPAHRAEVDALIDGLSRNDLERARQALDGHAWPAPRVAFRLLALSVHVGDAKGAAARLSDVSSDLVLLARARALIAELEARQAARPNVIGVLLPLSGRFAAIGREIRAAIEIAAEDEQGIELAFVDTKGDEHVAAEAVDELVAKVQPAVVMGPVGEREAAAAAARAAALRLPMALLSPISGIADSASGIVRLWGSGEGRARAAASVAVRLGFHDLAVFAPRDEQGRAEAEAFARAALALGARVVARATYDPTGSIEEDVKALLGLDPSQNERLRRHLAKNKKQGWKTFTPAVPFDLLFVPDSHDRAALVASFLSFFNVELRTGDGVDWEFLRRKHGGRRPSMVQLLGSSGWHDPALLVRGGTAVHGALVLGLSCEPLDELGEPVSDAAALLVGRFNERHGRAPSPIAAEAYDSARMVFLARKRALAALVEAGVKVEGPNLRHAMARTLAGISLEEGACARAQVDAQGELLRAPSVFRVERDGFLPQDPGN